MTSGTSQELFENSGGGGGGSGCLSIFVFRVHL